jgi:hypothetical protein
VGTRVEPAHDGHDGVKSPGFAGCMSSPAGSR